jgi:hypothetical protein
MHPSDRDDCKSTQKTQAFDPSPFHEGETAHPKSADDKKEVAEKGTAVTFEEDKEQTEVATKEALLRVTRGQL